jgi:hypothetical protein
MTISLTFSLNLDERYAKYFTRAAEAYNHRLLSARAQDDAYPRMYLLLIPVNIIPAIMLKSATVTISKSAENIRLDSYMGMDIARARD